MICWIEKKYKKEYINSSKVSGIKTYFEKDLNEITIMKIKDFISFIRNRYYIPIRLNIYFSNRNYYIYKEDKHKFYAVFFGENNKEYPSIYIASKGNVIDDIIFSLAHEITHYYQWYFLDSEKRTNRSLEIEANRWAYYIYNLYYEYKI